MKFIWLGVFDFADYEREKEILDSIHPSPPQGLDR